MKIPHCPERDRLRLNFHVALMSFAGLAGDAAKQQEDVSEQELVTLRDQADQAKVLAATARRALGKHRAAHGC